MIIIGAFEHSISLELMLSEIENNHVERHHIQVVPMIIDPQNQFRLISKKRDQLNKGIEIGITCAAFFSLLGACFGFILTLGPVFWGLILSILGFVAGLGSYLLYKKFRFKDVPRFLPELAVIIQCHDERLDFFTDMMWKYRALSVGRFDSAD